MRRRASAERASRFLKTSVRVCCALPSTIRAPHAHPLPRTPSPDIRTDIIDDVADDAPDAPGATSAPPGDAPGDARPHPNLPDDPLVRDPDDEDAAPPRASPRRDSNASAKRSSPMP